MGRLSTEEVELAADAAREVLAAADGAADALVYAESLSERVLRAVADLCYVEHEGHGKKAVARAVVREHGWSV